MHKVKNPCPECANGIPTCHLCHGLLSSQFIKHISRLCIQYRCHSENLYLMLSVEYDIVHQSLKESAEQKDRIRSYLSQEIQRLTCPSDEEKEKQNDCLGNEFPVKNIVFTNEADKTPLLRVIILQANTNHRRKQKRLGYKEINNGVLKDCPNWHVYTKMNEVYITGRYTKYLRGCAHSQSGLTHISIESELKKVIVPFFESSMGKFASSGREDIDVRMLGNGRPFGFLIEDPHSKQFFSSEEINTLQKDINEKLKNIVKVSELMCHGPSNAAWKEMNRNVATKSKSYRCVIHVSRKISQKDLDMNVNKIQWITIKQKTPSRTLHRRKSVERTKTIGKFHAEYVNDNYMILDLLTEAGTYIKEFVCGDFGRTRPSLGEIIFGDFSGAGLVDIVQLDVTGIYPPLETGGFTDQE